MDIPKKLKIGGHNFEVILKDRFKEDGDSKSGACSAYLSKIWIDSTAPANVQEETVLHEIIEAIKLQNDWELDHSVVCGLSEGLYQVLKDNNLRF